MRKSVMSALPGALALICVATLAQAAEQDTTERLREMLHRTQEALRQAQSDNAELTRSKTAAEQKSESLEKELDSTKSSARASERASQTQAQALEQAQQAQGETERKLTDANERLNAVTAKLAEVSKQLAARESELAAANQSLEKSRNETASCEAKNVTLYGYSQEVLQLYKNKGVWASLAQKEPVLGLKEVGVENVVQEYQLKYDSQRIGH
jgi:chromosome segregation ATPase